MKQEMTITKQEPQVAPFMRPEQKYMTIEGVRTFMQKMCGYSLSKSRIYALTMNDEIPHRKGPGGRLIFPIDEIVKWIEGDEKKEVV
jgi:hypothetical protein